MSAEGKYIYCIADTGGSSPQFGPLGMGGRGDQLYTVGFKDIGAVVSNSPIKRCTASRENFLCHEKAIEEVMKEFTVLPVKFCTIADGEEQMGKILEKEYANFKGLLARVRGKKELGLKALFYEAFIYPEILAKHEEIRKLKEKIAALPPEKRYYQGIEIGKEVEAALTTERERCKEEILTALKPLAEDTVINKTIGERMIINAAFLVDESREKEFDQRVDELDDRYRDKVKLKYVGHLPPFNFVNLTINIKDY